MFKLLKLLSVSLLVFSAFGSSKAKADIVNAVEICYVEHNGCLLTIETSTGRFGVNYGPAFNKLRPLWSTVQSLQDSRFIFNLIDTQQNYDSQKESVRLRMASAGYNRTIPTVWLNKSAADKMRTELALDREALNTNVDLCAWAGGACGVTIATTVVTSGASLGLTVLTCGASFLQCKATYIAWKQYQLKFDDYLDSIGKDGSADTGGGGGTSTGDLPPDTGGGRPGRPGGGGADCRHCTITDGDD